METIAHWLTTGDPSQRGLLAFGALFAVFSVGALLAHGRFARASRPRPSLRVALRLALRLACLAVLGGLAAQAVLYASHPAFFDPYEASVASVSGLVGQGVPLYHGPGDPVRYVQIGYGPMLYFINHAFVWVVGPTIEAVKLASVMSYLGALALMTLAFRRPSSRWSVLCPRGLSAATVLGLGLGYFGQWAFWTRADPLLVLCTSVGVAALSERRLGKRAKAVVIGVALGVAVNLKFTASLYFFPLWVLGFFELGAANLALLSGVAIVVAVVPFFHPSVSFPSYLYWIGEVRKQGIGHKMVWIHRGKRALFYAAPLLTAWFFAAFLRVRPVRGRLTPSLSFSARLLGAREHGYVAAVALTFGALAIVSSKVGATEHHFMPFFPVLIHAALRMAPRAGRALDVRPIGGAAIAVVLLGSIWTKQVTLWQRQVDLRPWAHAVSAEIMAFLAEHPGQTVAMGAGASLSPADGDDLSLIDFRPLLVFARQPYSVDVGTIADLDSIGKVSFPEALTQRMASCSVDHYLIPKGARPFRMKGFYPTGRRIFPDDYLDAFERAYEKVETRSYYDVYGCRKPAAAP